MEEYMKTRIVETKFWKDEYIVGLTVEQRLLYLYFITNERVNIIHCYEITDREIEFDTGIDRGIIQSAKTKFNKDGKIGVKGNYICLLNAWRYESYTGEKNENAKVKLLKQLPLIVAEWYRGIYRGIDTPLIGSISHKSEIISHKSEIINQKTKELREKAYALIGKHE